MKISCDPKQWGGAAWQFLHSISLCYPENPTNKDKERYKMFFLTLPYVLPCLNCQQHLLQFISNNIQKFEKAFDNNINLRKFIIDMHNHVNKKLNKPLLTYIEMGIRNGQGTRGKIITNTISPFNPSTVNTERGRSSLWTPGETKDPSVSRTVPCRKTYSIYEY